MDLSDFALEYWGHLSRCIPHIPPDTDHILEFGVGGGSSIEMIRRHTPTKIKVFGFDTFTGLPEPWYNKNGHIIVPKGMFSTEGALPDVEGVSFYKGLFIDTIPQYLAQYPGCRIGMLHIDCDLYSSTSQVFSALGQMLTPGAVLAFDEWYYNDSPENSDHEQRAFLEWIQQSGNTYKDLDVHPRLECHVVQLV